MRLVSLIVVLALATFAQAHGPSFAPCGGAASYAPAAFSFQPSFVPGYQRQAAFATGYGGAAFIPRPRVVFVPGRRAFAPGAFVPAQAPLINFNIGRRFR
jgi:hypothetical protein